MILKRTLALLAIAGSLSLGACSREKPAPLPAGETASRPPEMPIDTMPKLLTAKVTYPEEARQQRIEGTVVVRALVGKDGSVRDVSVDTTQAVSPILAQAAMEAVRHWTFAPARAKGEPTETWISLPVYFRLH
jgi:protein TonB